MARRASSRAIAAVALAAGALVGTLLVATVATDSVLGGPVRRDRGATPEGPGDAIHRTRFSVPDLPSWVVPVLLVLFILGVIAIIVFVSVKPKQAPERLQYEEEETGDGEWDARIIVELAQAAEEQLRRIEEGRPRNAIVACWLRFQEAATRAGLPPHPAETATEFTVRALRRLDVDDRAISTLKGLYLEARFSRHAMGDGERRRAAAAVRVLADQVSGRKPVSQSSPRRRSEVDSVTP